MIYYLPPLAPRKVVALLVTILACLTAVYIAIDADGAPVANTNGPAPPAPTFTVVVTNRPPVTRTNGWPTDPNIPKVHPFFIDYHAGDTLLTSTDGVNWRVADTNTDGIYADAGPTNQHQIFRSRGSTNTLKAYSPQP